MNDKIFNKHTLKQIHWKHLEIGKIYEIKYYVLFEDIDRLRLILKDKDHMYSLWAPDRIRYAVEGQDLTHIRSNGKIDGRWLFDIVYYEPESPLHTQSVIR